MKEFLLSTGAIEVYIAAAYGIGLAFWGWLKRQDLFKEKVENSIILAFEEAVQYTWDAWLREYRQQNPGKLAHEMRKKAMTTTVAQAENRMNMRNVPVRERPDRTAAHALVESILREVKDRAKEKERTEK